MGATVLSEGERKTLAEIERQLQEDARLRAFVARSHRGRCRMRRLWLLVLIASGVLMIGTIALNSGAGAAGSMLLGALSAVLLYLTPSAVGRTSSQKSG
jgi:hypothetical protein